MDDLENIPISFSSVNDNKLISQPLYGDANFDDKKNKKFVMSTARLIKD